MSLKQTFKISIKSVTIALMVFSIVACSNSSEVATNATISSKGYHSTERIVSTAWVEDNLSKKNVKIIDIRKPEDFDAGHIEGALNYYYKELQVESNGVAGLIPDADTISAKLSSLGVESSDTIIIYDHIKNLWASRLLWTLSVYGHDDARLMDGSYGLWTQENRSFTTDVSQVKASSYKFGEENLNLITSIDTVLNSLDNSSSIVLDTRSPDEYSGRDVRALRGGHIPDAINVEWVHNLDDDGRFLPAEDLAKLYSTANISKDSEIYTLCQTAVRATHSWFVLSELLGFDNVSVYDGSWTEWGNIEDTPIES